RRHLGGRLHHERRASARPGNIRGDRNVDGPTAAPDRGGTLQPRREHSGHFQQRRRPSVGPAPPAAGAARTGPGLGPASPPPRPPAPQRPASLLVRLRTGAVTISRRGRGWPWLQPSQPLITRPRSAGPTSAVTAWLAAPTLRRAACSTSAGMYG